jgi:hypothetical protein
MGLSSDLKRSVWLKPPGYAEAGLFVRPLAIPGVNARAKEKIGRSVLQRVIVQR